MLTTSFRSLPTICHNGCGVWRFQQGGTLRASIAEAITTRTLMTPQVPRATAVRSSGYFATAGLWIWAQYSTYVASSTRTDQGRLIQHSVFIESGCQARLSDNVTQLSDAIYQTFLADISTRLNQTNRS